MGKQWKPGKSDKKALQAGNVEFWKNKDKTMFFSGDDDCPSQRNIVRALDIQKGKKSPNTEMDMSMTTHKLSSCTSGVRSSLCLSGLQAGEVVCNSIVTTLPSGFKSVYTVNAGHTGFFYSQKQRKNQ